MSIFRPRPDSPLRAQRSTTGSRRPRLGWLVLCALLVVAGIAPAVSASDGAAADEATTASTKTFEGEFLWSSQRERGDLEATFIPAGDGEWTVEFRFQWNDQPKIFRGTATGSLTDGALSGTVRNESERRTWTFEGTFDNGVFRGEHEELKRGRSVDTGTLTLRE